MIDSDDAPTDATWSKRIAWLVILWLLGVAVLGVTAIAIKVVMRAAGLTS